jgi:hypothetical protein
MAASKAKPRPMRVISTGRVSMQRPGTLVAVTQAASTRRATDITGIARNYAPLLRRGVSVESECEAKRLRDYIGEQKLKARYPAFYAQPDGLQPGSSVEAQDLWLSDGSVVPSSTGAITDDALQGPPVLAAELQLIRPKNHTRTDRGTALLRCSMTTLPALLDDPRSGNPLTLTISQRVFLLYTFLDADLDLVQEAYRLVLELPGPSFTRTDFSGLLVRSCDAVLARWEPHSRRGAGFERYQQLNRLRNEVEGSQERRGTRGTTWGGARPPESMGTVRLEPYVDLGLLGKPSRSKYTYTLSERQRRFFERVVEATEPAHLLRRELIRSYLESQSLPAESLDDARTWELITAAHRDLRSRLGYAGITETILLASALAADEHGAVLEVGEGIDFLRAKRDAEPRTIKFGVSRGGGLGYVKIEGGAA